MEAKRTSQWSATHFRSVILKGTSNNYQFVTPAPYQVRGKLRPQSSDVKGFWIPAFAGMTFLEVAISLVAPGIIFALSETLPR